MPEADCRNQARPIGEWPLSVPPPPLLCGAPPARPSAGGGAAVVATDINMTLLVELEAEDNITTRHLDVTDPDEIAAIAGELTDLDVLVNGAGYVHHGTILECDEDAWASSMELNVTSMYRLIRALLPGMLQRGGGSIVNIASVASSVKGVPFRCVYGASKAAVIGLTKSVAIDYVGQGVRCNAICPGTVESPSLEERSAAAADPEAARKAFIARQPMGRLGTAEEIAALAVYLAADESAYMTGGVLVIDGGLSV
jgi:2-keto-3-deoxy-L-fuconate dehydrogenase